MSWKVLNWNLDSKTDRNTEIAESLFDSQRFIRPQAETLSEQAGKEVQDFRKREISYLEDPRTMPWRGYHVAIFPWIFDTENPEHLQQDAVAESLLKIGGNRLVEAVYSLANKDERERRFIETCLWEANRLSSGLLRPQSSYFNDQIESWGDGRAREWTSRLSDVVLDALDPDFEKFVASVSDDSKYDVAGSLLPGFISENPQEARTQLRKVYDLLKPLAGRVEKTEDGSRRLVGIESEEAGKLWNVFHDVFSHNTLGRRKAPISDVPLDIAKEALQQGVVDLTAGTYELARKIVEGKRRSGKNYDGFPCGKQSMHTFVYTLAGGLNDNRNLEHKIPLVRRALAIADVAPNAAEQMIRNQGYWIGRFQRRGITSHDGGNGVALVGHPVTNRAEAWETYMGLLEDVSDISKVDDELGARLLNREGLALFSEKGAEGYREYVGRIKDMTRKSYADLVMKQVDALSKCNTEACPLK